MTRKVIIGKIGKPHGLKGYAYVHLNEYIKNIDFKDIQVNISGEDFYIYEIKKHLKNRNLIKLNNIDTIDRIKIYRDKNIYTEMNNLFDMNMDLPWPELFLSKPLASNENSEIILTNYHVSNLQTVLEINVGSLVYLIPYVESNFIFENECITLVSSLSLHDPVK